MKPKSNLAAIRRKIKDVEKACEPGPNTYNQDDRILHEKLRDQAIGKEVRPTAKRVPGDYRPQLLPSVALVKPSLP